MSTDASAYSTLGLQPGADSAAIERAYKRLIKQHHPDRAGGDAARAAEITRAYRELRSRHALTLEDAVIFEQRPGRWGVVALLAGAGVAIAVAVSSTAPVAPPVRFVPAAGAERPAEAMDEPIQLGEVDEAIRDALRVARREDEMALTAASRACHQQLRRDPTVARLDRCAAFDSAVIVLQDRDPLRDRGPFSELAVTGRLMGAATLLSNDYLAIDGRLDRIRLRAELALAPQLPPPQVEVSESD